MTTITYPTFEEALREVVRLGLIVTVTASDDEGDLNVRLRRLTSGDWDWVATS